MLLDIRFLRNWQPDKSWSQLLSASFTLDIRLCIISSRLRWRDDGSKLLQHPDLFHWFSSRLFFLLLFLLSNHLPNIKPSQSSFIYWNLWLVATEKILALLRKEKAFITTFKAQEIQHQTQISCCKTSD